MNTPRKNTVEIRRICRNCGTPFTIYVRRPEVDANTEKSSLCVVCRPNGNKHEKAT